ncbi:Plant lipid transfer protein/Par allergen [Macleaya cordata]|uniref:Non-specific lipid-transfer protein n=1 Tax=Macleaya cordata TaxID=56857 RepID=A0A200PPE2_MACCD|nr:Plant lipid transfer protein/Par allergen [Macleaya cordata]
MAASSSRIVKLACIVMLACMLIGAPPMANAISCGQVSSYLSPCLLYLIQRGPLTPNCCGGVKSLNAAARTTPDRQTACTCLKSAAAGLRGLNMGLASSLPGKCGVNIPYKISPSTDCSKVR